MPFQVLVFGLVHQNGTTTGTEHEKTTQFNA